MICIKCSRDEWERYVKNVCPSRLNDSFCDFRDVECIHANRAGDTLIDCEECWNRYIKWEDINE